MDTTRVDAYEAAKATFDQELKAFETQEARLYRGDGQPFYSPAEIAERQERLTVTLDAALEQATIGIEKHIEEVRRHLTATEDGDPSDWLTDDEMRAANARAAFVKEDTLDMPLPELVARLGGVLASKPNKPTAFLWARYAGQRWAKETSGDHKDRVDDIQALAGLIDQLRAQLAPSGRPTRAFLQRRIAEGQDILRGLQLRHAQVTGVFDQERAKQNASGRYGAY